MASGDRTYLADKGTLDLIRSIIGNTNDAGGGEDTGTIMAKLNALFSSSGGSSSCIKSIQRGVITFSAKTTTATISAVDMNKAVVLFGGSAPNNGNYDERSGYWDARLWLSSSTQVSAEISSYNKDYGSKVSWQVIEFY